MYVTHILRFISLSMTEIPTGIGFINTILCEDCFQLTTLFSYGFWLAGTSETMLENKRQLTG